MTESSVPPKQFAIQKLYLKDASFESPDTPHCFKFTRWEPKIDLSLTNTHAHIEGDIYEAVLCITATIKLEEKVAFLIEVHFAGLFSISAFDDTEKKHLLGSHAMSILFPYAREVVSDMTVRGGFPPLILSPVNFEALYQQHLQQESAQGETEATH